jgi:hypothetical protein
MRSIASLVSEGFIWSVGITRPRAGQERRAALYITTTLILSVVAVVTMFLFLLTKLI